MTAARRRESGVDVVAILAGLLTVEGRRWDVKRLRRKRKTVLMSGVCSQYSRSFCSASDEGSSSIPQSAACAESLVDVGVGRFASWRVGLKLTEAAEAKPTFAVLAEGFG